jgi:hypothetical protein
VSVNDFNGILSLRDIECKELQYENEEGMMDPELEAEIMREILEEERIIKEAQKSKKSEGGKKKKKKGGKKNS